MNGQSVTPTYHVLLIGIDRYPPGYNSLSGCVNDIDAIEQMLLAPPGVGIPPEQIRVTRLAAPLSGRPSTSRFQNEALAPTKANLIQALKAMAGSAVKPSDRVLIYYSGHGDAQPWTGSLVWHEALVPHDEHKIEYLFDVEINALISAIAARTNDLTIVLDCCHSAGATRDLSYIQAKGAVRALKSEPSVIAPPDLAALGLGGGRAQERAMGSHLLQSLDPDYLVVVACQSDEKAGEGADSAGQPSHGVFTHSLLSMISGRDAVQRAKLRWADIWPELLAKAAERNGRLNQRAQHPWMIGRSERRLFGGAWEKMDAGYRVTKRPDGDYEVGAGRLMGVTEGAEIAVYKGAEPREFPPIGSAADQPVGRLKVNQAGLSSATAVVVRMGFALPEGARGRLVKPGESKRLRVSLKPADTQLQAQLEESPLLEIVPPTDPDADVEVITQPGGRWIIGEEEPLLATVPVGEIRALREGLEHLYRYVTVLRMARNCNDPQLNGSLSVRILDCNGEAALAAMSPEELADPALPEAPRDPNRIYALRRGFKFCVKVANSSRYPLNVTLLNCSAGGLVEYLSDALLRPGAAHVMWLDGKLGAPFESWPDELPAGEPKIQRQPYAAERMIAIGTTRPDVDLHFLTLDKRVQEVVNENLSRRGDMRPLRPSEKSSTAPSELWTATVTPIRISR
jgi:hypothetical protein